MSTNDQNNKTKRPVVAAGLFTVGGFGFGQVARFAANLVLTRLLVPEMFGVMALTMTFLSAFVMFSDAGLRQFIIRSERGLDPKVLDTVWIMQIIRGFLICLAVIALAGGFFLASQLGWVGGQVTYAHPMLPPVMAAMAICPLLNGFQSTKRFEMNRKLFLGSITTIQLSGQIIGVAAMVLFAWIYQSIWALVAGNILQSFLNMAATHAFLRGHNNTISWDSGSFREIFNFSRWIVVSSIFQYLVKNADLLWLGALISAETMGIYSIGKALALVVKNVLERLSRAVVLPELSNVARENNNQIENAYYKMRIFIDVPSFFVAGVFLVIGPNLIEFLYDPRYLEAGIVFQVLSIFLISNGSMQAGICLVAIGLVKKRAMINGIYALSLNLSIPLMFMSFGFYGVLIAIVVCPVVPILIFNYYLYKNNVFNFFKEIRFLPMIFLGWAAGRGLTALMQGQA